MASLKQCLPVGLVAVAFAVVACDGGSDSGEADAGAHRPDAGPAYRCVEGPDLSTSTVALGRPDSSGTFAPLSDDDPLEIVRGNQGGQHTFVSVRLFSSDDGAWSYEFELTELDSGARVGGSSLRIQACPRGWTESKNVLVFVKTATLTAARMRLDATRSDPNSGAVLESLALEQPILFRLAN